MPIKTCFFFSRAFRSRAMSPSEALQLQNDDASTLAAAKAKAAAVLATATNKLAAPVPSAVEDVAMCEPQAAVPRPTADATAALDPEAIPLVREAEEINAREQARLQKQFEVRPFARFRAFRWSESDDGRNNASRSRCCFVIACSGALSLPVHSHHCPIPLSVHRSSSTIRVHVLFF
jgi:hypothetical protein